MLLFEGFFIIGNFMYRI